MLVNKSSSAPIDAKHDTILNDTDERGKTTLSERKKDF